jgi:plastocyanin
MVLSRVIGRSLVLLVFVMAAACGSEAPAPAPVASGGGMTVDEATAGVLSGRATFSGTPPAPETLHMGTDAACVAAGGAEQPSDAVLVDASGGLANVFVYVTDGLDPTYSFPVPETPVVLDQAGCRYHPHVLGIRVGQPLEVVNSDDTLHNVHALPVDNAEFNEGQPLKGLSMTHVFTTPEVAVRFKCDVHSWMSAYVGVVAHPFFAVTASDGSFSIPGLPPGTYTIEAWHERFGRVTEQVTIGAREIATLAFTFSAN